MSKVGRPTKKDKRDLDGFMEGDFPDIQKLEIRDPFRVAESMFVECEK
jgi:hypothetical protein